MLEKFENEFLLVLVGVNQIIRIEVVVVLPDEHLPESVTQLHSVILLLIILLYCSVFSVADVDFLEYIEKGHVEHVRIHVRILHASTCSRLQTMERLEAFDYHSIIHQILEIIVCLDWCERLVESEPHELQVGVSDAPIDAEKIRINITITYH